MIFLLHFLVVAAALFGLASGDEGSHIFEDLIGPAKIFEDEMATMDFQKPMISFVLLGGPMALLDVFLLFLIIGGFKVS